MGHKSPSLGELCALGADFGIDSSQFLESSRGPPATRFQSLFSSSSFT
jgi:hypothetical protein